MGAPQGFNAYTDPESGRVEYAKPGSELENYLVRDLDWDLVGAASDGDDPEAVKVSDAAAKLADELDVDLSQVEGTGKGGSITKADVEDAANASDEDDGDEPEDE